MSTTVERRVGGLLRRLLPGPKTVRRRPFAPPYLVSRPYSATKESTKESITLPDQRTLSFAKYGAIDGYPVFYFHGHPGSRLEGALLDEDASDLGATLISVDRPGLGHSTPKSGRKPSGHAQDIENLALELGLKEYKILAVSGGGPYGLACARFHSPSRLKGVALLAGMAWLPNLGHRGMRLGNKFLFQITRTAPGLLQWLVGFSAKRQLSLSDEILIKISQNQLNSRLKRMPAKDKEILADGVLLRRMLPSTREHFRQGVDGFTEEQNTLSKELDFDLKKIDVISMSLWYGKQDINVPCLIGEELVKRLGNTSKLTILDETHLSLLMKHKKHILEDLLNRS